MRYDFDFLIHLMLVVGVHGRVHLFLCYCVPLQLRWSTCHLKFFSWLLDHAIYLKLIFLLLLQAEQLTK